MPQPIVTQATEKTPYGVIYFGSTTPAMEESLDALKTEGIHLDAMRLRAFPFPDSVAAFIHAHEKVFVVEQNRDAQMHTLITTELEIDGSDLSKVLHYDGTPITARFISQAIRAQITKLKTSTSPKREKESV